MLVYVSSVNVGSGGRISGGNKIRGGVTKAQGLAYVTPSSYQTCFKMEKTKNNN